MSQKIEKCLLRNLPHLFTCSIIYMNCNTCSLIDILPFYSNCSNFCQNTNTHSWYMSKYVPYKTCTYPHGQACYILVITTYLTSTNFSFTESDITNILQIWDALKNFSSNSWQMQIFFKMGKMQQNTMLNQAPSLTRLRSESSSWD